MPFSRATVLCLVAGSLTLFSAARDASAQPADSTAAAPASGGASRGAASSPFAQASQKWEATDLDGAVPLYQQALDGGGLAPQEVVTAYARIGTYQAAMGKSEAALSAFRLCAAIDPAFKLPSESGPKAEALYQKARKEADALGGKLELTSEVPTEVEKARKFEVVAHLPEGFAPLADKISVDVRDPISGKSWRSSLAADPSVTFEVPATVVVPGATLVVRVQALDARGNRFAIVESRVKVKGRPAPVTSGAWGGVSPDDDEPEPEPAEKAAPSTSFWKTPWPYVIGGAILVGSVGIYAATRPSDQVSVGAARWQ